MADCLGLMERAKMFISRECRKQKCRRQKTEVKGTG